MKTLIVLFMALLSAGCSGMRVGTVFDGTFCNFFNSVEAKQRLASVIAILPDGADKQKAITAMSIAGVSAEAICLMAREFEGRAQAAP